MGGLEDLPRDVLGGGDRPPQEAGSVAWQEGKGVRAA
jgi:hypothetical protein